MRVVFMGTGEIGAPTLEWLIATPKHDIVGVVTQPDKPVGRHHILTPPQVKILATQAGIPVLQPPKVRLPEALTEIRALNPEIIVVMAYGQILPQTLLDISPFGCLNLHASLLPKFRGASPINAAILAGETVTGITVMQMDVGLDTGDMILKREIPIGPTETAGVLHDSLALLGPDALEDTLDLIAAGKAGRIPQDDSLATYCGKLDRDSGRIDWTQPAGFIERQIRAMHPWPGAFTVLPDGRKLKIHQAHIEEFRGEPGKIVNAGKSRLVIAASSRSVELEIVQPEGRKPMSASDFLRGYALA
jgi:methionyl-tRNA formyltransferase